MNMRFFSILSLMIAFLPAMAGAQTSDVAVPAILQGETYFTREACNDFLNPVEGQTFEQTMLKHVTTPGQANQLLFEYGLIFSDLHETAVKNFVRKSGILEGFSSTIETAISAANGKRDAAARRAAERFGKLVHFEGEGGRQKLLDVLQDIETLSAAGGQTDSQNLTRYARARNLIKELRQLPPDHPALQAFARYTEMTLVLTYTEILQQRVAGFRDRARMWFGWPSDEFRRAMSILLPSIAGAVNLGYYVFFNDSYDPHLHCVPMTVASIVAALGVPVTNWTLGWIAKIRASKVNRELNRQSGYTGTQYRLRGAAGNVRPRAAISLRGREAQTSADGSILEVAAERTQVLDFNPVEIAYLGDAEMLDLKELYERLMTDFGREPKRLAEAREAAEAVLKDPKDFEAQLHLRTALEGLLGERPEDQIRADWALFQTKLAEFKTTIEKIREIPYRIKRDDKNSYSVTMAKFLTQRLLKDLNEVADEEFNTANLEESLGVLSEQREELDSILNLIKHYNGDWATAAENTLLMLEKQP